MLHNFRVQHFRGSVRLIALTLQPHSFFPVITCSHLNAMGISTVNNPNCIDEAVRPVVYTTCEFTCPQGYVFEKAISQTVTRYCKEDGQWNGMDDVCIGLFISYRCFYFRLVSFTLIILKIH